MKEYQATVKYYDLLYNQETVGDEAFWLQMAGKSQGPILELGCGTGRVTFLLAGQGYEITGLDNSEPMLVKTRKKLATRTPDIKGKVMLCKGDMADFSLENRFKLIIIPFRGFQHVERQASCLACVREHLDEGGVFVVTLFNPDIGLLAGKENLSRVFEMQRAEPETNYTILRYTRNTHDYAGQIIRGTFIYERIDPDGTLESTEYEPYRLRWTWRWEMEYLLRLSGFEIDALYGNYHCLPFPEASAEMIFVCSHAS